MNEGLGGHARWRAADEEGRDDDADRAFRAVFPTLVTEHPVSPAFTTRTMAAVAAAAQRDARRERRTRVAVVSGSVVGGSAAAYFGIGWAVSFLTTALVGFLNLVIAAIVQGAAGLEAGAGFWGLVTTLGRAAMAFATDPTVTFVILAIFGIALAALFALQHLLGPDTESLA